MDLLAPRTEFSFKRFEAVILGLYAILVGWITVHHEAWSDEAQAWLIARDSTAADLFLKRLHYEGTPGLWHLLLWILSRFNLPYAGMHWATALLGTGTVYLLLRYAPFPKIVRATLPFGFFLLFQAAIIARSYSLASPLVFLICMVLSGHQRRPLIFALLCGLLANTSLFGLMLAFGILPLYFLFPLAKIGDVSRVPLVWSGVLLAVLVGFAIYTAVPAPDASYGIAPKLSSNPVLAHILGKITGVPVVAAEPVKADPPAVTPERHGYKRYLWQFVQRIGRDSLIGRFTYGLLFLPSLALYIVSSFSLLALFFYWFLVRWLIRHKTLWTLFPFAVVLLGSYILGFNEHHSLVLWTALLASLWLTWGGIHVEKSQRPDRIFHIILLLVLIEQVAWTGHAASFDAAHPFDGGLAASRFLMSDDPQKRVASVTFFAVSMQPYRSKTMFYNQATSYWPWKRVASIDSPSSSAQTDPRLAEVVAEHPALIVDGEAYTGDANWYNEIIAIYPRWDRGGPNVVARYLQEHGYRETHRFCGLQPSHFGFSMGTCEVVYEPNNSAER
jgi:hypothetical protein